MSTMNIFTKDKTIEGTCKDVGLSEKNLARLSVRLPLNPQKRR